MQPGLGADDRDKLDEYFTSVRELEQRLVGSRGMVEEAQAEGRCQAAQTIPTQRTSSARPGLVRPHPPGPADRFDPAHHHVRCRARAVVPPIPGVTLGHHDLSHHGQDPNKIEQLKTVELETMKTLRDLLAKLKQTKEEGASLLDRTMVFFGSNLGNASSHSTTNLPVLLAGGGFKHGQHLAFDPKNPPPLCNLYVSMLQRLGIEADKFGSSTGTLTGLEMI